LKLDDYPSQRGDVFLFGGRTYHLEQIKAITLELLSKIDRGNKLSWKNLIQDIEDG
jgi:hypothetical protein